MTTPSEDTTALLRAWSGGSERAAAQLMRRVYPELRRVAAGRLANLGRDVTLEPTEVVHELFLRLVDQRRTSWVDRTHFFAICARIVHRVVVNHARDRRRQKRGGGFELIPLEEGLVAEESSAKHPDLLALEESLRKLRRIDSQAYRVVELRYFGGLTLEEVALVLGISRASVVRSWRYARVWLKSDLSSGALRTG